MKLKVCRNHSEAIYTLQKDCKVCSKPSVDAHYKFIKIRDVRSNS